MDRLHPGPSRPLRRKGLPPDIRRILDRGELVVAIPKWDLSPFFFAKDGQLQGVDIETAQGLAKALGTWNAIDDDSYKFTMGSTPPVFEKAAIPAGSNFAFFGFDLRWKQFVSDSVKLQ